MALLGAYLAPYIPADVFWPTAFLGLAYPILAIVNMLFVVYWLLFLNMKFLFSLAALVIGWSNLSNFIQFNAKTTTQTTSQNLTVVSFNARYFGALDGNNFNDWQKFGEDLSDLKPDIVCVQEMVVVSDLDSNDGQQILKNKLGKYNKAGIKVNNQKWYSDNLGLFSKHPIINKGLVEKDSTSYNYSIFADIVVYEDTIRVINTHLQSIKFENKEYKVVKELEIKNDAESKAIYKGMLAKLKQAFVARAKQTDAIREFIAQSPYKIIVCGDFNDAPSSYSYKSIKGDMKDAFTEAGSGLSRTYVGAMPSFRIDYILANNQFSFYNYRTHRYDFSDHKMVSCTIGIK